jgi:hypothetical protein
VKNDHSRFVGAAQPLLTPPWFRGPHHHERKDGDERESQERAGGRLSRSGTNDSGQSSRPAQQRGDEQPLSGSTAERVRQAALGRIPGGTVDRLETDADGHTQYEAHMRAANGNRVTVYVNADFEVVEVEEGR